LAFSAIGIPWHGAELLTVHGRPLAPAIQQAITSNRQPIAFLTDKKNSPSVIASALLDAGASGETNCVICERLGLPEEQLIYTNLQAWKEFDIDPLNVFVLPHGLTIQNRSMPVMGLPDEAFSTNANQITKREIRLLVLGEMNVQPKEVVWDIGAGSGSVSIEVALQRPTATIYSAEKRELLYNHLTENIQKFSVSNIDPVLGLAPEICADWPDPDVIFIGGSGGNLAEIITVAQSRLRQGGRFVATFVTLENLLTIRTLMPDAICYQAQIGRGKPIGEMMRLEAQNPVFIVKKEALWDFVCYPSKMS